MNEILLCYGLLLNNGLISIEKYNEYLDAIFLNNYNNDLLLELQFHCFDLRTTVRLIYENLNCAEIDVKTMGVLLLNELKNIYLENLIDIKEFGERTYSLWTELPLHIGQEEPLHTLCYANDPLYWSDEEQTRDIYEKLFEFYSNKTK